jgi:tRNA A-37 threonylcarbamoyl transferase component Bud32
MENNMIAKVDYLILKEALSILHDYLYHDDSDQYPEGVKEGYWKAHKKAEDILREFEEKYNDTVG